MSKQCRACAGKCCTYFCFQIDEPDSYAEFENVRWYLCHEGVSVHIDDGDWFLAVANRCRNLTRDGRCKIYENRPLICREYSHESCDHTSGDYEYEKLFETPEQMERYARKTLGARKFDAARKRALERHEKRAQKARKRTRKPAD